MTTRGISFSVGVIQLDRAVGSIDDLLGRADEKMYAAKQAKQAKHDVPIDVVTG